MRGLIGTVIIASVFVVALQSQRDGTARNAAGASSISGRVTTTDTTPRPLGGAIVTLKGSDLAHEVSIVTDENGTFAFLRLPAGRFTVEASKAAFLSSAFGATRPGRPGTPLSIAAGQARTDVVVALTHGAALSGMVRGANGQPAPGTQITVLRPDGTVVVPLARTDDRGMYRVFGLAPGDYVIAAAMRIAGFGDLGVRPAAEVDAIFTALQARAGRSGVTTQAVAAALPPQTPYALAPVFYPGTPIFSQAARVSLAAAEDRDGLDFTFVLTPVVSASGTVSGPGGPLPPVQLGFTSNGPSASLGVGVAIPKGVSGVDADGRFRLNGLAPGDYRITARTTATATSPMLWAAADVTVNGQDITGITLALRPGLTFAGRVAFDASSLAPPRDLKALQVRLVSTTSRSSAPQGPAQASAAPVTAALAPGTVRADGRFEMTGILPAVYDVACAPPGGASAGWWLRSVMVKGRDVLDQPIDLNSGDDVADAVVLFSDRHSELSGTLQTPAGQPAPGFVVVVLPADRALWRPGARRIQLTRPASDGHFAFKDLPAGKYVLAALTDIEPGDLADSSFLASVAPAGVPVTVVDGQHATQTLRLVARSGV